MRDPLAEMAIEDRGDVTVARVEGEVDMSNASRIGEQIADAVPNSALGVVLDLSALDYLDSAGVQLLFNLSKGLERRQQQLRLVVADGGFVQRVLTLVDLARLVPIDTSVDDAMSAVAANA